MRRGCIPLVAVLAACYPTTTRPPFGPVPTAPVRELKLPVGDATRALAVMLDQDSIPVRRTEPKDGWLETGWFDARTLRPTSRRPLGDGVVRVRAWVDPSRPGGGGADTNFSTLTVETVYRPLADPSRPDRELDEQVPDSNPVARRIAGALAQLAQTYGGVDTTTTTADSAAGRSDSTASPARAGAGRDSARGPADSTKKKPVTDSLPRKPRPDTGRSKPPVPRPDTGAGTPLSSDGHLGSFLP